MVKVIAVDFDGTLCEAAWPHIGEPLVGNIRRAKQEQQRGARLILWTCREGEKLKEALAWCAEHGLRFDAVNCNAVENIDSFGSDCRKVYASEYWDDRAVHTGADTIWRRELLDRAIDRNGITRQVDMAIEEMSELTKALLKHRRALLRENCDSTGAAIVEEKRNDILEEMADVQIMLDQLRLIYGECDRQERNKLLRLERNLGKEEIGSCERF